MRRRRDLHLTACLVAQAFLAWAPAPVFAQTIPSFDQEWRWVDFDAASGLPPGVVQDILDVDGVIWVRTDSSVAWFDDFQWQVPSPMDGATPSGRTTSLAPDSTGGVLVVRGGRLYRASTEGLRALPAGIPDSVPIIRAIPHVDGAILATTGGAPARLWRLTEGVAVPVEGLPPIWSGYALTLTRAGRAWIDTEEGLHVFTDGRWTDLMDGDAGSRIISRVTEGAGGLGFIHRPTYDAATSMLRLTGNGPPVPVRDEGGNLLLAGDVAPGGLAMMAYETGDLRARGKDGWTTVRFPSSRQVGIRAIHLGADGDLWFGSSQGVHLYRGSTSRYSVVRQPFPNPRNRVNAILLREDGLFWLGTTEGVLQHMEGGAGTWHTRADGVELGSVTSLAQDSAGNVWAASGGDFQGLLRWDGSSWTHLDGRDGFDVGFVHELFVSTDGSLWMASLGGGPETPPGVYRWRDGELMGPEALGLPAERAYAVAEGPDGAIWAVFLDRIYRIQAGNVRAWTDFSSVLNDRPRLWDVAVDGEGRPWVAFTPDLARGFVRIEADGSLRLEVPPGPEGTRKVWSLTFDEGGSLWAGTEAGVWRFGDGVWSRFDETTGLPTVNVWPVAVDEDEDQVLIGTKGGGLVILSLREAQHPPPRVVVRSNTSGEHLTRVEYAALAYRGAMKPDAIETRYRVDDGPWSDWSTTRVLTLDAGAGDHTLDLQAKGLFGQLSSPVREDFQVPPPLFLRPEYALPMGGLLLTLLILGTTATLRRLRHDRELRLSEQRLRTLLENAPEAIVILDVAKARFVEANEKALELLDVSLEELSEIDPESLVPPRLRTDGAPPLDAEIRATLAGETPVMEWAILNTRGEEIPCEIRLVRLPADKRQLVRVSLVDIRDRVAAMERRTDLEAQLRQALKLEAVGKLSGGIAHDFNNLLTVIRGNLELLVEDYPPDTEQAELVDGALEAVYRSTQLSQRLLAVGRRQALEAQPVDMAALLTSMEDLLRRSLGETVTLAVTIDDGVGPAMADAGQLENAILNLSINARDAMPKGGRLQIEVWPWTASEDDDTRFSEVSPGEYVGLSVTDDGSGMSPEVAARAFDPFFTTKEVGKGSGLGLSMVYGFATQSGGSARIQSEPGGGTRVEIVLPRASTDPAEGGLRGGARTAARGGGERVLVVEDDPGVTKLLTTVLGHLGYSVVTAASGDEALELLKDGLEPDILVVDLILPGSLNGMEFAQAAVDVRAGVPVLYMSGYGEDSLPWLRVGNAFPEPLLRKPFDQATLALHIRRLLDSRPRREV